MRGGLLLVLLATTAQLSSTFSTPRSSHPRRKWLPSQQHPPRSPPLLPPRTAAASTAATTNNGGEVERPLAMAMSKRSKRRLLARTRGRSQWTLAGNGPRVDYLVVVDFEATCERGDKAYEHEIIEFPAVLVRTADATLAGEFHAYVRPTENATLSAFCTELTGIAQETVDAADTLDVVLARFNGWLDDKGLVYGGPSGSDEGVDAVEDEGGQGQLEGDGEDEDEVAAGGNRDEDGSTDSDSNGSGSEVEDKADETDDIGGGEADGVVDGACATYALATDGPWDLKYFMEKECLRKGGALEALHRESPQLHRWVNLRWLHAAFYNRPRMGVNACLRYHRMTFEGRPHSGIDDTRNIARIARRMLEDGCDVPFNDGLADDVAVRWRIPSRGRHNKKKRRSGGTSKAVAKARAAKQRRQS